MHDYASEEDKVSAEAKAEVAAAAAKALEGSSCCSKLEHNLLES
jgi:hypothetical protein